MGLVIFEDPSMSSKEQLRFLPDSRRNVILHVVQIIRDMVSPEKIILFGSYAKGKMVHDTYISNGIFYEYISDIDILIVTAEELANEKELEYALMEKVDTMSQPVNLQIHDIRYINKALEIGQYFFTEIVREGIVLYDTSVYQFSSPKELSPNELKELRQEYYDQWFPNGAGFMNGAKFYLGTGELKLGAFSLHQAAEALYYAFHLVFTGYKPKTHKLARLRQLAKHLSEELYHVFPIKHNKTENHLFDLLKRGYKDARYKKEYTITQDELEQLILRVKNLEETVQRLCLAKIQSIA